MDEAHRTIRTWQHVQEPFGGLRALQLTLQNTPYPVRLHHGAPHDGRLRSPQPPDDPPAAGTWARPGRLTRRSSFALSHLGQVTFSLPKTSVSNVCSHDWQEYSYIGMGFDLLSVV